MTDLDKFKALNLDRMDALVSERLAALKLTQRAMHTMDPETAESICRDLLMPVIFTLASFIEAVKVDSEVEK